MKVPIHFFRMLCGLALVFCLGACESAGTPCGQSGIPAQTGSCGLGLAVVNTDYVTTELSALAFDGGILSRSLASSAQAGTQGRGLLSGDAVLPLSSPGTGEIIIIDREYNKIEWIDPQKALPVRSAAASIEFKSNPHDYLNISNTKAYLSRYEPNLNTPAPMSLDEGSDILVLDPQNGGMLSRIDMMPAMKGEDPAFFARPDRMIRIGDRVYVLLQGYSLDFIESAESRVVVIDTLTDSIIETFILKGLHGCSALALAPEEDEIAVGCSGEFAGDSLPTLEQSGLVLLSVAPPLSEKRRWMAVEIGAGPLGLSLSYAAKGHIVFSTLGLLDYLSGEQVDDVAIELDTNTGVFRTLLSAEPFSLGDIRCAPLCSSCFIADSKAQNGAVHMFLVNADGSLSAPQTIPTDSCSGHPPRYLGIF